MKKKYTIKEVLWRFVLGGTIQLMMVMFFLGGSAAHNLSFQEILKREVTLQLSDVRFEKVLTAIETSAKVKFVYSRNQLDLDEKISITVSNRRLGEVLNDLLFSRGIQYTVRENNEFILLTPRESRQESSLESDLNDSGKPYAILFISGTVTDAITGQAMAGVNVIVKGTTKGASTDADGRYIIEAEARDILVFSFIGYKTVELAVTGDSVMDIAFEPEISTLKEVTVNAGYWETSDREKTGSISKLTSETISKQPVANPLNALQGRMPGVLITSQNGLPGSAITVRIRGTNSIRPEGNDPLYIVDGVPFTAQTLSSSLASSGLYLHGTSPLYNINPADIESIEILKDADATAIYGSRGANGVVLISTKRGSAGDTRVEFNMYSGIGRVNTKMNLLNTKQYLEMRKEAFKNDGVIPTTSNARDLLLWDTTRNTDWKKELIGGTAHLTSLQTSISGGNVRTQFLIGMGYYGETSVFPGDFGDRKISGQLNISHATVNDRFKIAFNTNFVSGNNNLMQSDLTSWALRLAPNSPAIYDENGELNWENNTWFNPLADLKKKYESKTDNLIANTTLRYELIPGLLLKTGLGFTFMSMKEISTQPKASYYPSLQRSFQANAAFANSNVRTWIAEPQVEYNVDIGAGRLTVLTGATFQQNTREGTSILASGFTSDALIENIQAAPDFMVLYDHSVYRYQAIFGRVNYNLHKKYIFNLTGRRDGSSRFGSGKQFANFGAGGFAWIFSNENFLRNSRVVSFGKLRSSYGITGNDQIPDYGFLDTYSTTAFSYQGQIGLVPTQLVNKDFAWENNKKFEGALELGFIDDRILLTSAYYYNRSSNQLVGYPLPLITGQSIIQFNLPATLQNSGFEFELNATHIQKENFTWQTGINFTLPRNKLIEYPDLKSSPYANTYTIGESLNTTKGFQSTGVDPETGVYRYTDVNGNESGTDYPDDLHLMADMAQKYFGGIQNTINYGGFQLDVFFYFVKQTGFNYLTNFLNAPGTRFNQPDYVMERWQNPGDASEIQRFTQQSSSDAGIAYSHSRSSNEARTDASFIRLKNLSLSWQVPSGWSQRFHLRSAKIYTQGINLITITNYKGMDPENQNAAVLPPLRIITAGIQITL